MLFGGTCHRRAWEAVGLLASGLTGCLCHLSFLLPQHGAQCFPTYRLPSRDSGLSGHTKLKRGFRNCLTHTRICIQVCKFLETSSKDGICRFLRLDLPLRWPCWLVPFLASPSGPAPHPVCSSPSSPLPLGHNFCQSPLCAPLFPNHATAFLLLTGLHCPSINMPCDFLSL